MFIFDSSYTIHYLEIIHWSSHTTTRVTYICQEYFRQGVVHDFMLVQHVLLFEDQYHMEEHLQN